VLPPEELAREVGKWDLVLLPYVGTRGQTLSPAKLFNCFAVGRPVAYRGLSLPDHLQSHAVKLDDDTGQAIRQIVGVVGQPQSPTKLKLPTWTDRWAEFLKVADLR